MAVAAYASLVSLTHVLDNVHYRAELRRLHVDIKEIEDLQGRVNFLLEFVEVHSEIKGEKIEGLWKQMSEVAIEAEEVFDLHVVSQLQLEAKGKRSDLGFLAFTEDIVGLIQKIDVIEYDLLAVKKVLEDLRIGEQPRVSEPTGGLLASATSPSNNNTIVGFDDHAVEIMKLLAGDESTLQILSIVGMGGIGKTTLAKKVYHDRYIVQHFELRIWLTVSQFDVNEILKGLLDTGDLKLNIKKDGTADGLGETLRKKLYRIRYLIVMDDVWTEQIWNDLKIFFPNNRNQSRVMMTTRLLDVAKSCKCHNFYSMTFLDDDKSWDLFCQTVFTQKDCPYPNLKKLGMEIVKSCKGLPLEIIVIGGLLAKSYKSEKHWKKVAKNVSSFVNSSDDEHCLKILGVSYNNLPTYLKPCFLYMRVFHEDQKIDVFELIKYWADEGYIKKKGDKSLEEIGKEYMKDLVDRNLIFFHEYWLSNGNRETCGIHDLLRDLCLSESDKEKFMRFPRVERISKPFPVRRDCFVCKVVGKSFLVRRWCFACRDRQECFICRKLIAYEDETYLGATVLISPSISQDNIPRACGACRLIYSHTNELRWVEVGWDLPAQHTKLRHVAVDNYRVEFASPSMLHFLWNLQTLIIQDITCLPCEIWEMPQLRYIEAPTVHLPDPPVAHREKEDFFILKNLHTLRQVRDFKCTNEVLNTIPNLKELEVSFVWSKASLYNLVGFQKLESLLISCVGVKEKIEIAFPLSLKKLYLLGECRFPWSDMSIIGSLPNLETLTLSHATEGSEWKSVEDEFLRLKVLSIECEDLVQWTTEESHFPNLELLQLYSLCSLEEIPSCIGDILTLCTIKLQYCSESAINSAHKIWKDQQDMGNETLEILVGQGIEWLSINDFMHPKIEDDEDEDDNNDNDDDDNNDDEDEDDAFN